MIAVCLNELYYLHYLNLKKFNIKEIHKELFNG